jgi:hypothetical protein
MMRLRQTLIAAVALATALVAAPSLAAEPTTLKALDINRLENWADALAACDMTSFLMSDPDLEAGTIIAPGVGSGSILYRPLYLPPNLFYAPSLLQAFEVLQAKGEVDRKSVGDARYKFASAIIPKFHKASEADKAFLVDQMKLCNVLTDGVMAKARPKAK